MQQISRPLSTYGVATDEIGLNGIRAEQARVCLRAITGNMSAQGVETVFGPGPIINGKDGHSGFDAPARREMCPGTKKKAIGRGSGLNL